MVSYSLHNLPKYLLFIAKSKQNVRKLPYISLLIKGVHRASLRISWFLMTPTVLERDKEAYCILSVLRVIIHSTRYTICSAFIVLFTLALSVLWNSFFTSISLFVLCPRTICSSSEWAKKGLFLNLFWLPGKAERNQC